MTIKENILVNNPCYTAGRKITVKGLMLHSVGCPQPRASAFLSNWGKPTAKVCVHAIIDGNDGAVYQTLPWNHRGWHCGGNGNGTHIGVEMCEPACIRYTGGSTFTCSDRAAAVAVAERTYKAAVELFAHLCKEYNLDPLKDGVIISHAEGHKRGIASNHGDPDHLWRQLGMACTMSTFRQAVADAMRQQTSPAPAANTDQLYRVRRAWDNKGSQLGAFKNLDLAKKCADENEGFFVFDEKGTAVYPKREQKVRVSIDDLNIRRGPGTNFLRTGAYTGKGVFTITEVQPGTGSVKGWGRLKSGAGWISMDFADVL